MSSVEEIIGGVLEVPELRAEVKDNLQGDTDWFICLYCNRVFAL